MFIVYLLSFIFWCAVALLPFILPFIALYIGWDQYDEAETKADQIATIIATIITLAIFSIPLCYLLHGVYCK